MYICMYVYMFVCIYAGERRDAAKFVWGCRGQRVKVAWICRAVLAEDNHIEARVISMSLSTGCPLFPISFFVSVKLITAAS